MFIPLNDNIRIANLPILTIILVVINIGVFALWESNNHDIERAVVLNGVVPYELTHSGTQCVPDEKDPSRAVCDTTERMEARYHTSFPNPWFALLTAMFLHGGLMHLLGNMLFLGIFGRAVEQAFGAASFLMFYLVGGLAASIAHVVYDPASQMPAIGASGAIAAVMAGYLVLFPKAKVLSLLFGLFPCHPRAWLVLGMWLVEQSFMAYMMVSQNLQGGVAVFAHFGGFLAGLVLTYVVMSRDEIESQRLVAKIASGDQDPLAALAPMPPPVPVPEYAYAQQQPYMQQPQYAQAPAQQTAPTFRP